MHPKAREQLRALVVRGLGRPRLHNVLLDASARATPAPERSRVLRDDLARRFLAGEGIEIGALNVALRLPPGAHVRYVDRKANAGLAADFPELDAGEFVTVDVVDDGETLAGFADGSLDFVIANHFIEHTQDPIAALGAHLRVLRDGGILFMVVPDGRFTLDRDRPLTTLAHVRRDHEQGPAGSRREHYREWVSLVERFDPADVDARAARLEADGASIHFHVWDFEGFLALVELCRTELGLPLRLEHAQRNGAEFLLVLRKA